MLLEKGSKAYISDKIVDGVVKKATRYICLNDRFTRVGDSVQIKGKYKEVHKHNIVARHSFCETPEDVEQSDDPEDVKDVVTGDQNEDGNQGDDSEDNVEDVKDVEPKYTFIELKSLNKQEQNAIAKELGLKGYHNLSEDDRIDMILEAIK